MASRRAALLVMLGHPAVHSQETFRSSSSLVLLRFSAMQGVNFVTNLTEDDIVLTEDGQPQKIALFEGPLDAWPARTEVDFHVLVDISGTVSQCATLTARLLRETLLRSRPSPTKITIHAFAYRCSKLTGPTSEDSQIEAAIRRFRDLDLGRGRPNASAIYDAILKIAHDIDGSVPSLRPVLIVFSDGLDTSEHRMSEAARAAQEKGLTIYPVMVVPRAQFKFGDAPEEYATLGPATGGRGFWPPELSVDVLSRIINHIVNQVSAEYTLGYYREPARSKSRTRTAVVRLKHPGPVEISGGTKTIAH